MEAIAEYALRLSSGAVICALILSLTGTTGFSGRLRQMICGLFLAFLAISPLRQIDPDDFLYPNPEISTQANRIAEAGKAQAEKAFSEIITEQYEAYILSKADELKLTVTVTLRVEPDTGIPVWVMLHGQATPYEKTVLTNFIHQNLGVERSGIHWNP